MSNLFSRRPATPFPALLGLALLILLAAVPATAALEAVEIDPPDPDDMDEIDVIISGSFPTPCWMVDGFLVQLILPGFIGLDMFTHEEGKTCAQVITPFSVTYHLGQLDAGEYELTVWEHRDPMYFWGLDELTIEFTVEMASVGCPRIRMRRWCSPCWTRM